VLSRHTCAHRVDELAAIVADVRGAAIFDDASRPAEAASASLQVPTS
jgi:hypothetical protein